MKNLEDVFSSLLPHDNRWKEDSTVFMNAVNEPPEGRFMK